MKNQNYINHIVFVVDDSGSMSSLKNKTVEVFDSQIKHLASRSKELTQETRATIYLFGSRCECTTYDMDVMRLPSIKDCYKASQGSTALIDATRKAIAELKETPQRYGDHAFLIYVLTDGGENVSNHLAPKLAEDIQALPENWTVAVLVPDQNGVYEAKKFGFPKDNIAVWSTDIKGLDAAGDVIRQATESFMTSRAQGVRGTRSLFKLDATALNTVNVAKVLEELKPAQYRLLNVAKDTAIKPFVESWITGEDYRLGSGYYQLTKAESVQAYKQICVQDKRNGKVYSGTNARGLLGLPNHEIKVSPADFGNYDIFVQSTSTNRKLIAGTKMIVLL